MSALANAVKASKPEPLSEDEVSNDPLDLVVLKFGSSVLATPLDVPGAVSECYRHVRQGRKVLAVVSAFGGVTDRLLAQARELGLSHDNVHLPRFVALGEEKSAAALAIGCDRVGLEAMALSVAELGLWAEGRPEEAQPLGLDKSKLFKALSQHDVVVVPGFAGMDSRGRTVLLGRGGSDLTAVFLAAELGQNKVRLVKDVDGVYESDPNKTPDTRRFSSLSYGLARQVAGRLVLGRALDYAEARNLKVEVSSLASPLMTVVGSEDRLARSRPDVRPLRVAVAGCGVVGAGLLERLMDLPDQFEVVAVLVRDVKKPRDVDLWPELYVTDLDSLFSKKPDLVVDALSSGEVGERLTHEALWRGVHVVSANKQALAKDLPRLHDLAKTSGAQLSYSASVGGGAPLVEVVNRAARFGPIQSFEGLLNGTVNFMLDQMARGHGFDRALEAAQKAGFAEEDPKSDLDGADAAAKVRILAQEAFGLGKAPAYVACTPLEPSARGHDKGLNLKQLARCERKADGSLFAEVRLVPVEDPILAETVGEGNALKVTLQDGRVFHARGRGAGRWPTVEAVLADLVDLWQAHVAKEGRS